MNNKIIAQGLEDLFCDKRITIVYGVLKRLHITPLHSDYDDLFQEGCLAYAAAYADFTNQPSTTNLAAFAYQRIYWRLLDLLRRRQYGEGLQEYSLDDQPLLECGQTDPALGHVLNAAYFTALARHCSLNQRRYLHAKLNHQLSDRQIADYYAVSPAAVYQWKKGLIAKARQLNYNEEGFGVTK
ncbi:sigma-70 family RNA polymerase sigma factor [Limosilactobacillus sp.]|uniref:sigma-70 family RNA polymerase sigma factor n=1 Tax=Limosilactobacillus sp. TaxID=2773925 RepID=UPI003F007C14